MFDDLHKLADKNLNNPSHASCCNKDTYILFIYMYIFIPIKFLMQQFFFAVYHVHIY